jgi:hypothetical protein
MIGFKRTAIITLLVVGFTEISQASLVDRGNGLLYDDVLNLTWLQDANYAKTSGYSSTGKMDWISANNWAANLNYQGLTGWRLASNTPINGISFNINSGYNDYNGVADNSYNITSQHSELAYMYYVNLNLKGHYDTVGNYQSDFGIYGNGTYDGVNKATGTWDIPYQNNVGPVMNLQSYAYWSGSGYGPIDPLYAWYFYTYDGLQIYRNTYNSFYAWAVHPGDVAAVPVPGAIWLFASGLGLLSFTRRKNKNM